MDKVVVRMSAGLANRMFQYAYALYLKKLGYDVYVDNKYKASQWQMEDIDWKRIFPCASLGQASSWLIFRYGGSYTFMDKLRRHYLPFSTKVLMMNHATDVPTRDDLKKAKYIIGVMQDAEIAQTVKEELLGAFRFADFPDEKNCALSNRMSRENSVAIHLRKGQDYMKKEIFQNTCTLEYYQKAIEIIKSKIENPTFYVFTDNATWVKNNLKGFEYTLIEGNPSIGWGNHFDMQLMSCCKHNIIANSTYSWWGAFLNPNPNKIVIDPKYWFNPQIPEYAKLPNKTACDNWIMV